MIAAAALLVGWLLFVGTRLSIGDVRIPRIHAGSLQGLSGGAPAIHSPNGAPGEAAAVSSDEAEQEQERQQPEQSPDDPDVERAVYDRLYGQRGRRD